MADPLMTNLRNLSAGAKSLADAAVGAQRVDKALAGASRAGSALKAAFKDMLSPLGLLAGLAVGLSIGLYKAVMNSRLLTAALERASQVQVYSAQFELLLGGLRQAKQRLNELASMAARGPFKFDDLTKANERLERLSRGALGGKASMQMVADAAAAAGVSTEQMAGVIGGAFEDAFGGRSIEGSIEQLRAMGAITASTADRIIGLERAGARGKKLFNELSAALKVNQGAAAALSATIAGLNSRLEETKGQQLGSIGEMFAQGEMDGLKAAISIVETLGPVVKEALMPIAALANLFAKAALGLSKLVKVIPGLKSALTGLAQAATVALLALTALGALQLVQVVRALLIPLLIKLTTTLFGAAAAGGIFGRTLGFIAGSLLRFLGPIGIALAVLDLLGVKFSKVAEMAGLLPDAVKEAGEKTREASRDIEASLEKVRSSGTTGEAIAVLGAAEQNFRNAEADRKRVAAEKGGETAQAVGGAAATVLGLPVDALAGVVNAGAQAMGMGSPFKTMMDQSGAVDPTLGSEFFRELFTGSKGQADREAQTTETAEEARRLRDEARASLSQTPSQFLNDPDYAAAQAEALQLADSASKAQDALDSMSSDFQATPAGASEQARIDALRAEAQTKMAPDAMAERFDRRMAREDVQAKVTRSIAEATGNEEMRREASRMEDSIATETRAKELQKLGIERPEALQLAQAETLTERLSKERGRAENMTFASGLGSVGGAAGEAGGGTSEEARLLGEIKRIMERQSAPNTPAALPEKLRQNQR
jgi:hypothetical protein